MSNTRKHKKKAKEKKIRDLHALNAIQRKAGANKDRRRKRSKDNGKKKKELSDLEDLKYD